MADETAADAKYKGKEVWITDAPVDSYLESESGCYLIMRWFVPDLVEVGHDDDVEQPPSYILSSLKLEPQYSEDFKDVEGGLIVEVVGECQGISEGVVIIEINRIAKVEGDIPDPAALVY